MTMPKLKAPKLSFEQAIGLLPKEFHPVERASYHRHKLRAVYQNSGTLPFHN